MKHRNEIERWAECPDKTNVWRKRNGDEEWILTKWSHVSWDREDTWVVDDEWAEIRKASIDGKEIQFLNQYNEWEKSKLNVDDFISVDKDDDTRERYRISPEPKYPVWRLFTKTCRCKQYIVKFTGKTTGVVVAAAKAAAFDIGETSERWTDNEDKVVWEPVSDPTTLFDKDPVECWDKTDHFARKYRFYDEIHGGTFSPVTGMRNSMKFDNMHKLMPWEIPEWMIDSKNKLGR